MSGGNANWTIARLPTWQMYWGNGSITNFQLDIVGFLAVLGESSVVANAQVSALSRLFYLPRLLPAPQALLPPSRATSLPSTKAWVTSVHTGNVKEHVHHVANIVFGDDLPTFTVRCVHVKKKDDLKRATRLDTILRGIQSAGGSTGYKPPPVKAKATGPLSWVTLTGFFLSLSLFLISMLLGDGFSMIATVLLSLLSTLIGIANKWTLKLQKPPKDAAKTVGDTVVRYPNGSFLVVKCDDEIARELYFAPEEIEYEVKSVQIYRIISLLATLILMLGIIFLANARLELQFAWAGAYGIINAAHWAAAAVPPRLHWDLSCYEIQEEGIEGGPKNTNFTEALWKAILVTKSTRWVRNGGAAPQTDVWDDWLMDADEQSKLAGSITGPLQDPIPEWAGKQPEKATIWAKPKDWDAKKHWDEIDLQKNPPHNPGGGMHGSRAV